MAQIDKPNLHFNTKLYSGNGTAIGSGGNAITGVGFQSDWTWIKARNDANESHYLFDAVRGVTKSIRSNGTSAEGTDAETLTAFDSDGFTLGNNGGVNSGSLNYASWNWKANGTGSANTDGSTNSTVSVNQTAGFSIVTYTGTGSNTTVGHGLGVVPKMIIFKNTAAANDWRIYHVGTGNTGTTKLNNTDAVQTNSAFFNNTSPTSSVFTVSTGSDVNTSGNLFVAYCFAEKKGFSKFGSYTGNGNADGTFIYCGFKPAFVMLKRTDAIGGWIVVDNKRDTFNVAGKFLYPHDSGAEQDLTSSHTPLDLLSNGMKMRSSNLTGTTSLNISGASYIYMAFAENPIVGSNNIPATAR